MVVKINLSKEINNLINKLNNSTKQKKYIIFFNWLKWSILIKAMFIKKDVWNWVSVKQKTVQIPNLL